MIKCGEKPEPRQRKRKHALRLLRSHSRVTLPHRPRDLGAGSEPNPSHFCTVPEVHAAALTAASPRVSNMETKADYIAAVVACKLVAVFSAAPLDGPSPLTVTFTDQSQNATAWLWDFGDGSSSTAQNPTHTYTEIGTTTVTLTVMNECGSDTITEEITVTGYNIPIQTITVTEQRWWLFKRSTAAIHVVDSTGRPVADAVVEVMNNQQPMAIYFYGSSGFVVHDFSLF